MLLSLGPRPVLRAPCPQDASLCPAGEQCFPGRDFILMLQPQSCFLTPRRQPVLRAVGSASSVSQSPPDSYRQFFLKNSSSYCLPLFFSIISWFYQLSKSRFVITVRIAQAKNSELAFLRTKKKPDIFMYAWQCWLSWLAFPLIHNEFIWETKFSGDIESYGRKTKKLHKRNWIFPLACLENFMYKRRGYHL